VHVGDLGNPDIPARSKGTEDAVAPYLEPFQRLQRPPGQRTTSNNTNGHWAMTGLIGRALCSVTCRVRRQKISLFLAFAYLSMPR
jgi:hypothetical protein